MRHYGEELVYWYFRLNGFIPIVDFVLHGDDALHSRDCDLIAVRFSYPADHPLASEFEGEMCNLAREYKGGGESFPSVILPSRDRMTTLATTRLWHSFQPRREPSERFCSESEAINAAEKEPAYSEN